MGNKFKRLILCILAVASVTVTGTARADDEAVPAGTAEEVGASEAAFAAERSKRSETSEKAELSAADAEAFLKKIGSAEGLDIYYKDKDFDDAIWESHGGKPASKKDYTDEQQALADKIESLKKLGELVAVDTKTGAAAASFKKGAKCSEGMLYVSDAGRYFVITDENTAKVLKAGVIISSLDSADAFLSGGGDILTLLSKDHKDIDEVFSFSGKEDGKRIYRSGSGEFAWVSEDMSHFLGAYRFGAENDSFRMIVDSRNAIFGLENKETGYIWWSSPPEASQDKNATGLVADELRSSNMLRYGVPLSRSNNNMLRSGTSGECEIKVTDIENGIMVVYDYPDAGFSFPAEYVLEGDHLRASVRTSEIKETNPANIATEMTILGSFGAASDKEDGYFVIPDGSGALVRFNNKRSSKKDVYQQRVYGPDITAVPATKGAVTEQIYMPVYGIVKEDNAMLVIASEGDSNAYITANVSGQSSSSYNICNFTFILRSSDNFYMSGSSNERYTVFESGDIKSGDIELLYYPISAEDADFSDIAKRYRQYLLDEEGVTVRSSAGDPAMYLRLYGGVMKKKSVLGFPVNMKTSLTGFSQAEDIINSLKSSGVDDMVVSYSSWTSDGISGKIDTKAKPAGILGGKSDFRSLSALIDESGFTLYPASDNRSFLTGNGFFSFKDTAVRVSGSYSRIVSYDRAYGIPDGFSKNTSLLSPKAFGGVFGDIAGSYPEAGLGGASLGSLTSSLYGDYGKKGVSRAGAMELLTEGYAELDSALGNGLLAETANAYAFPYVSHITGVPLSSSRFDIFDEDIPFFQLVMHGVIPYSTTAVNGDADSEMLLLMAAATGSNLSFDMIYEETEKLKDTRCDVLYYANYEHWTETAAKEYELMKPILSDVSDSFIADYKKDGNIITTTYENGTVVRVDLENKTIEHNGMLIDLGEYAEKGGVRF